MGWNQFMQKVIIVGTGCAGLTAAIYSARSNLDPLVLEGSEPGGQLTSTTLVENFPGFPEGIDGPQLVMNMHRQAEKFGAIFKYAEVQGFEPVNGHYRLHVDGEAIETQSVIIATGASAKWLGLEGECKLKGHGLTSCATCDGAFYRNVPVCVVGGGDTATEEAIFLTRFASEVFLIHRRNALRATKIMAERALNNPKIKPVWNTAIRRYVADSNGEIEGVELQNVETDQASTLPVKCVFVAIGHTPKSARCVRRR
jgi:thioredoxin reductase (NADPH)